MNLAHDATNALDLMERLGKRDQLAPEVLQALGDRLYAQLAEMRDWIAAAPASGLAQTTIERLDRAKAMVNQIEAYSLAGALTASLFEDAVRILHLAIDAWKLWVAATPILRRSSEPQGRRYAAAGRLWTVFDGGRA